MRVVFVHGACVKDGDWWWHATAELLEQQGVRSDAAVLPSAGETGATPGGEGPGLSEDVASLRTLLDAGDEPTVVVAHSYGGIVTAEAAAGVEAVRHLLLISSYLPEVGESLSTFGGDGPPPPFLAFDPDAGTFGVNLDLFPETFMHDCAAEITETATSHLARQSLRVLGDPVQAAAWKEIPSTYLVCAQDRGTPPERQRAFATKATHVVEIEAGHHPFLSQPAAVRDLVLGL